VSQPIDEKYVIFGYYFVFDFEHLGYIKVPINRLNSCVANLKKYQIDLCELKYMQQ